MLSLLPAIRRGLAQKRRLCVSGVASGSSLAKIIQNLTGIRHLTIKAASADEKVSLYAVLAKKSAGVDAHENPEFSASRDSPCAEEIPIGLSHISEKGLRYTGYGFSGALHGDGTIFADNNVLFQGSFYEGGPVNGQGLFVHNDGSIYEGAFVNGEPHGPGTMRFPDGTVKTYEYQHGSNNRLSTKLYSDGSKYEGEMVRNRQHGRGKLTYLNGQTLEGEFRDGKIFNGHGHLAITDSSNGRSFLMEGEFREGKVWKGKGSYQLQSSDVYEGELKDGKHHGQGKFTYPDGRFHEGEFKEGKLWNGTGVMLFKDGNVYEGKFNKGKHHGQGKLTYPDGRTHEGTFSGGKLWNGSGTILYPNGGVYEGAVLGGKHHGFGTFTAPSGQVEKGMWENGQLLAVAPSETTENTTSVAEKIVPANGAGELLLKDGGKYKGELVQGMMHGQGKITYPDGRTLEGMFRHDKICNGKGTLVQEKDQQELTGEWRDFRFFSSDYLNLLKEKKAEKNERGLFFYCFVFLVWVMHFSPNISSSSFYQK